MARILSLLQLAALAALSLLACCAAALAQPDGTQNGVDAQSSTADHVYASARPRLLQIRTLLDSAGRQTSLGSGFLISADGLAVTNYHVVSQYALEPATYRLEYAAPDGSHGAVKLRAIDVVNDLAVVRARAARRPAEPAILRVPCQRARGQHAQGPAHLFAWGTRSTSASPSSTERTTGWSSAAITSASTFPGPSIRA